MFDEFGINAGYVEELHTLWLQAPQSVDPRARDQTDEERAEARRNDQDGELAWSGAEHEKRDERQRRPRDNGSKLRHGLADPKLSEIAVFPQRRR